MTRFSHLSPLLSPMRLALVFVVALSAACADDAQFTARHAAEVSPNDRVTVSVFGVFKDGMMNRDAWELLGPRLSRGLHGATCAAAYAPAPLEGAPPAQALADETLVRTIDDYTRDNGVTDELLEELAPVAEGDLLVTFTVAGHPPSTLEAGTSFLYTGPSPVPMQRGGMRRGPRRGMPSAPRKSQSAYEIAASFYSPKLHRSVALLAMTYRGASEDEALTLFVNKLAAFFPHSSCAGVAKASIDPERIRALAAGGGEPRPPPAPLVTAPASSAAAPASSAAAPVASAPRVAPSPAPAFTFVGEATAGSFSKAFRLRTGLALFESTEKGWQLRVARGRGPLSPVDALRGLPESRRPREGLFVGETADSALWLSLFDESHAPALDYVTLRVSGNTVTRTPHKWLRALASLDGGDTLALTTTQNPALLADPHPQSFERTAGRGTTQLPTIPADVRLYDVDVLPSGGVHATASRATDSGASLVGWVGMPGDVSRTLAMPRETEGEQPRLVHGGPTFLATVDGKGLWIGERDGQLVVKRSTPFTCAAASPGGDVWFADRTAGGGPRLRHVGPIDFTNDAPFEAAIVPLPSARDLAAAGASAACQDLGFIDTIVALPDGTVWLSISCASDGRALLRTRTGSLDTVLR